MGRDIQGIFDAIGGYAFHLIDDQAGTLVPRDRIEVEHRVNYLISREAR